MGSPEKGVKHMHSHIKMGAELISRHPLGGRLDAGSTNTCIDQIFLSCGDLLSARMICGAGGGGFLQAVLKK